MTLKEIRLRHGEHLTQKKVAGILGIKQPDYANIENGRRPITPEQLRRLEKFYGQKICTTTQPS
jgi:transcriptional regulator with XRE-family HTH domain